MEERVAVVPGTAFGPSGEGHVRCCYATALPLLETALERISHFLRRTRQAGDLDMPDARRDSVQDGAR